MLCQGKLPFWLVRAAPGPCRTCTYRRTREIAPRRLEVPALTGSALGAIGAAETFNPRRQPIVSSESLSSEIATKQEEAVITAMIVPLGCRAPGNDESN